MPSGPTSRASTSLNPLTAHFDIWYAPSPGRPCEPPTDDTG